MSVDFYHRHFFDQGLVVLIDNLARIAFLFLLAWLIYAPDAAISGCRFAAPAGPA